MEPRVVVILGGDSAEREISLQSGANVSRELGDAGFEVATVDPCIQSLSDFAFRSSDIAFPMLHGTHGEDGVLQRQLNSMKVPFVGSCADVSELTFDKARTQTRLKELGYPVPEYQIIRQDTSQGRDHKPTRINLKAPLVVKPTKQGSSVGISIVRSESKLTQALQFAWQYGSVAIVEKWIDGAEVTVPVIDQIAFPAIEIRPATDWYDYSAKYESNETEYRFDTPLLDDSIKQLAEDLCRKLNVSGLARVDFRIDPAGRPWILEINTIPGMTDHSLVPKSIRKSGHTVSEVCAQLVRKCWAQSRKSI